jgi:hypothetical protein
MNNKLRIFGITLFILLSGISIIPQVSAVGGLETFDDDTVGQAPTASWYTYSSGGGCDVGAGGNLVVSSTVISSGNSLGGASGSGCANIAIGTYPCTGSIYFSADIRFSSNPTGATPATGSDYFSIGTSGGGQAGVNFYTEAGVPKYQGFVNNAGGGGGYASSGTASIFSLGSTVSVSGSYNCASGSYSGTGGGVTTAPPTTVGDVVQLHFKTLSGAYIDNWYLASTAQYTGITPSNTSAIFSGGIKGFSVSKNGYYVGVTYETSSTTRPFNILNGNTLASQITGGAVETNCGSGVPSGGVVAIQDEGVAYYACGTVSHTIDKLRFVSATGAAYPLDCSASTSLPQSCPSEFGGDFDGYNNNEENNYGLVVNALPGAVEQQNPNSQGEEVNYFGLVFGMSTGRVADTIESYSYYHTSNSQFTNRQKFDSTTIATGTGQMPSDMCSYGNFKVFVVDTFASTTPMLGYTITPSISFSSSLNTPPTVSTSILQTYSRNDNGLAGARYIDCADNEVIVERASPYLVTVFDYTTNQIKWQIPITSGTLKGVTISGNGSYAAYSVGSNTYIIDGTTGEELGFITNPEATIVDIEMDNCAQNLFIAGSTKVYRYNITANTTGDPVDVINDGASCGSPLTTGDNDDDDTSVTSTNTLGGNIDVGFTQTGTYTNPFSNTNDNIFGIDLQYTADGLGIEVSAVQVMLGLILMTIFAIWFFRGTGSVVLAVVGAFLGMITATVMGLLPPWIVMAIVFLLIIVLGKMIFGGFAGGEES